MFVPYTIAKNMFDEVFDSAFNSHDMGGMMRTDIKETDDGYELILDLPGIDKEHLSAELKDGYLCISATVGQGPNQDDKDAKYLRRERFVGTFRRSFYVGENVKQEDIKARMESGSLHLYIPKETKRENLPTRNLIAIEG